MFLMFSSFPPSQACTSSHLLLQATDLAVAEEKGGGFDAAVAIYEM